MSTYDYNVIVIGGGSAGLVSSYIAAALKSKVALIEKHKMGGDCLNTGCVPSKALLRSAKMLSYARRAEEFGFNKTNEDTHINRNLLLYTINHDYMEKILRTTKQCVKTPLRLVPICGLV